MITVLQPDLQVPLDRLGPGLQAAGAAVQVVPLEQRPVPTLRSCGDAIVVLGGRQDALDCQRSPFLVPLRELLVAAVEAGRAVLGICLGHQILADALGGQVIVADSHGGEEGACELEWLPGAAADPVLAGLVDAGLTTVAQSHHDVVAALPPGAVELARSDRYPNQAFRIGSALGLQFHPEASPELMARWCDADGGDADQMLAQMRAVDAQVAPAGQLVVAGFVASLKPSLQGR